MIKYLCVWFWDLVGGFQPPPEIDGSCLLSVHISWSSLLAFIFLLRVATTICCCLGHLFVAEVSKTLTLFLNSRKCWTVQWWELLGISLGVVVGLLFWLPFRPKDFYTKNSFCSSFQKLVPYTVFHRRKLNLYLKNKGINLQRRVNASPHSGLATYWCNFHLD